MNTLSRIFDPTALIFLGIFGAVALIIGLIVGAAKGESAADVCIRGFEGMGLSILAGLIARSFIILLLVAAGDSKWAGYLCGWGFFLIPGIVDTIPLAFGAQPLSNVQVLPWIATGVGALGGFMDGLWRIHRWRGPGVLTFLLDYTWCLVGTTLGCLLHLVNFLWAGHASETRTGCHRYESGLRFKSTFAVTLGAVMSNMTTHGPGSALFEHEDTHVLQNRIFGPFFSLTYLGWMVFWFPFSFIIAAATKEDVGGTIQGVCYFNNPWEAWAYNVGCGPRTAHGFPNTWGDLAVILLSIPFFLGVIAIAVFSVYSVFS